MFGPEEIIYRDNDFVDTLYIITKGRIQINMPYGNKNAIINNKLIYIK